MMATTSCLAICATRKARIGLMIVVGCILIVVANIPSAQSISRVTSISLRFIVSWVTSSSSSGPNERSGWRTRAVLAEREREAADAAALAEREREGTQAVTASFAERGVEAASAREPYRERSAIAREYRDIISAMSVMVLQVGAVRHRLPEPHGGQAGARAGRAGRAAPGARRDAAPAPRPCAATQTASHIRPTTRARQARRAAQ